MEPRGPQKVRKTDERCVRVFLLGRRRERQDETEQEKIIEWRGSGSIAPVSGCCWIVFGLRLPENLFCSGLTLSMGSGLICHGVYVSLEGGRDKKRSRNGAFSEVCHPT